MASDRLTTHDARQVSVRRPIQREVAAPPSQPATHLTARADRLHLLDLQQTVGNRTATALARKVAPVPTLTPRRPAIHRAPAAAIQRHASDEHMFLGNMPPASLRILAEGKDVADKRGQGTAISKLKSFGSFFGVTKEDKATAQQTKQMSDALRVVNEQMTALAHWRDSGGPDPDNVDLGSTAYDHHWGGQLVVIDVKDGERVVATVGDINALPDFFGSLDDAKSVSKSVLQATLQVIRREAYIALEELRMKLSGEFSFGMDKKMEWGKSTFGKGAWKGAENVTAEVWGGSGPEALANIAATENLTRGQSTGGSGRDEETSYKATLARNACHFPPESWLRWKQHHEQARGIIESANSLDTLNAAVNQAVALNAFGEHYLQDSYAGGHLINKGFVMALALEYTSEVTNNNRGMGEEQIAAMQEATAHREAYEAPALAQDVVQGNDFTGVSGAILDSLEARDPQSALEKGKASNGDKGEAEVTAAGLDPSVVSIEQYRTFLNDTWYQKLTNALHDKFCVNGLEVSSPEHPALFRIYGDYNMLRSAEGSEYAAGTSEMSRNAINALAANRRAELVAQEQQALGAPQGNAPQPLPVPTVPEIMIRLPNSVKADDGNTYDLGEWATGAPMRQLVKQEVEAISLNQAVRGVSALGGFTGGLTHKPF